ncbi:MAG: lactonase family protein [Bryobacteraceae bacterium]|jgi:6-phosphogluconolactonase
MKRLRWILPLAALMAAFLSAADNVVYVGTYTGKGSQGIYAWRFDATKGRLSEVGLVGETTNPSFLAVHPNGRFLYAVNETSAGSVTSFSIDEKTAKLTELNHVPSGGADPCHLVVDPTGRAVIVANYTGGSVASFPLAADGTLGNAVTFLQHSGASVNKARQAAAHAHDVALSRDNRFAIICDLGMDKLMVYHFDPRTGALSANDPPFARLKAGSGPRHFAFDAAGAHGYAISELASTITTFDWDASRGALREIQTVSTLPTDFKGENTTAEIAIHPSGRFLYGSNRGHDSLALFMIDRGTGTLKPAGRFSTGGRTPRSFAIDPTGKWLLAANQDTNDIVVFRIDEKTGALKATGRRLQVSQPVCVLFAAAR